MITALLIVALVVASYYQRDQNRYAVICFAMCSALHQIADTLFGDNWGFLYYFTAAFTDLIIINLLFKVHKPTKLIINLQKISFLFILNNLMGYIVYEMSFDPAVYNNVSLVLFSFALFASTSKGRGDDLGIYTDSRWNSFIYSFNNPCFSSNQRNKA